MASNIHILDDGVINKIAAGEVVERPASIIKELVENCLDAGATEVSVELEEGGCKSIVVRDNGGGISVADAPLVLRRHATSKISTIEDLFSVQSMGFRGEALASIASVSKLRVLSQKQDAVVGFELIAQDDKNEQREWRGEVGTTVVVEDLFYNVPARRKFLKSPTSEYAACLELLQSLAMARPDISLKFIHNGKEKFNAFAICPDGGAGSLTWGQKHLQARLSQMFEHAPTGMLYISAKNQFLSVEGLISPPGIEKPTGKNIFTFVNGRWVKDKILRSAILRGYHSHLLRGRFPQVMLHVTMDPSLVDVNVHPHKTEVRFQYLKEVQELIAFTIRRTIRQGAWVAPMDDGTEDFGQSFHTFALPRSKPTLSLDMGGWQGSVSTPSYRPLQARSTTPAPVVESPIEESVVNAAPISAIPWQELKFVGSYNACYLMFETSDQRLLVVDQHAFHERIVYERLIKNRDLVCQAQPLLVPEEVRLTPTDMDFLLKHRDELKPLGFDFEKIDDSGLEVRAVPSLLSGRSVEETILALVEPNQNESGDQESYAHYILSTLACHTAIRAGEELSSEDLQLLLAEAQQVDFYLNCPHGRRVFKWWNQSQVAAWFDR